MYLPKDYFTKKDTCFPVLYYLHGQGSSYSNSKRNATYWNKAMEEDFPQTVIVSANGVLDDFYGDKVEQSIIQELMPHIVAMYRGSDKMECTGIFGVSMGGHGTVKLAFRNPLIFSQALSING